MPARSYKLGTDHRANSKRHANVIHRRHSPSFVHTPHTPGSRPWIESFPRGSCLPSSRATANGPPPMWLTDTDAGLPNVRMNYILGIMPRLHACTSSSSPPPFLLSKWMTLRWRISESEPREENLREWIPLSPFTQSRVYIVKVDSAVVNAQLLGEKESSKQKQTLDYLVPNCPSS